jgi:DNA-binding NarL/FixJ family response regulator
VRAQNAASEPLLVIVSACLVAPSGHLNAKVQHLPDENNFLRRNQELFTRRAARAGVLRCPALGHSSPEIAAVLHLSAQTADTYRRTTRQKLRGAFAFELGQLAQAFDVI